MNAIQLAGQMKGDIVRALCLHARDHSPATMDVLQVWHVLDVADDTLEVEAKIVVGAGADGEEIYERFAGLLGLPSGTRGAQSQMAPIRAKGLDCSGGSPKKI